MKDDEACMSDADRKVWIVVAWLAWTAEPTGNYLDRYGLVPEMRRVESARAVIWAREWRGSEADGEVQRAREHAIGSLSDVDCWRVFVYPGSEPEPLDRARREMLGGMLPFTADNVVKGA